MADPRDSEPDRTEPLAAPCRHLRSNRMYVFSDGSDNPDAEVNDSSNCWCLHTMKPIGPDDGLVDPRECRNAARSCYQAL